MKRNMSILPILLAIGIITPTAHADSSGKDSGSCSPIEVHVFNYTTRPLTGAVQGVSGSIPPATIAADPWTPQTVQLSFSPNQPGGKFSITATAKEANSSFAPVVCKAAAISLDSSKGCPVDGQYTYFLFYTLPWSRISDDGNILCSVISFPS